MLNLIILALAHLLFGCQAVEDDPVSNNGDGSPQNDSSMQVCRCCEYRLLM